MDYALEDIGNALKQARERKGLSQRALSDLANVPQAQISKIENGSVDLQVSTLLRLARTLDLEPVLAPRKSLSAITSIIRSTTPSQSADRTSEWSRYFSQVMAKLADDPERSDYAQIGRALRDLDHLSPTLSRNFTNRIDGKLLQKWLKSADDEQWTRELLSKLLVLRNEAAHSAAAAEPVETVRPAYTLDDEDDDA